MTLESINHFTQYCQARKETGAKNNSLTLFNLILHVKQG